MFFFFFFFLNPTYNFRKGVFCVGIFSSLCVWPALESAPTVNLKNNFNTKLISNVIGNYKVIFLSAVLFP